MPASETDRKSSTIYTENTVTFRILSKLDLNDRGDCVEVEFNLKPLAVLQRIMKMGRIRITNNIRKSKLDEYE